MSWTEDNNITTTWYEDRFHSGEATKFNDIEKIFNIIEYKFNEIDPLVTPLEDRYREMSWTEDAIHPSLIPTWSEDAVISTSWSED